MSTRIELHKFYFSEVERKLFTSGEFEVSAFTYASGIQALRVKNDRGEIIVLPFKGQQVWRAAFDGRDLTMQSMFDEPVDTQAYLETYGAFLIHCGLTGMGAPGPTDTHPLHGELPNAPFQTAWLNLDEQAGTITIAGSYQYTVAFTTNYCATTSITMAAGSAVLDVSVSARNLKNTPMDLMYLAHANFRPVDHGELVYCATYTPEAVRVRQTIPAHITPKAGYAEFLAQLADQPDLHHTFSPEKKFDPEVVFSIDMLAGEDGLTHAIQKHPDGTADYISYKPAEAPICMRWICRTPDQNGLGVAFPSTSEVEGYTAEKIKGHVVELAGGDTWSINMRMGLLTTTEVPEILDQIARIKAG